MSHVESLCSTDPKGSPVASATNKSEACGLPRRESPRDSPCTRITRCVWKIPTALKELGSLWFQAQSSSPSSES